MNEEREIDLLEVFKASLKELKANIKVLVCSCMIIFLLVGLFGVYKENQKEYSANMLVRQETNITSNITNSKLEKFDGNYIEVESDAISKDSIEKMSTGTIISILNSDYIYEIVYKNLGIDENTYNYKKVFEITSDKSSDLINIVCKIQDEELAIKAINEMVKVFKEYAPNIINVLSIDLIGTPHIINDKQSSFFAFIEYGFVGGVAIFLVIYVYLFIKIMFDHKVRTEEEVMDIIQAPIISRVACPNSEKLIKQYIYGIKEIKDYLFESKGTTIQFIAISNDDDLLETLINEINICNKRVKIIKPKDAYKDNCLSYQKLIEIINQEKKSFDLVFVIGDTINESHDYALISKCVDTNIVIVKKNCDKLEHLSQIINNSNIYNFKINGVVFSDVN